MLTHPTIDQLRALRLDGMAEAFVELQSQDAARDLAPAEWLALLLEDFDAYLATCSSLQIDANSLFFGTFSLFLFLGNFVD